MTDRSSSESAASGSGSVEGKKPTPRTNGTPTGRVRAEVDSGICGFTTTVLAEAADMRSVTLTIESECPQIRKAAAELGEIDMLEELRSGLGQGRVYEVLSHTVRHVTCPVGAGILKAAEAAAGLALPKDVSVRLTKE
jgi:hypothetical protein